METVEIENETKRRHLRRNLKRGVEKLLNYNILLMYIGLIVGKIVGISFVILKITGVIFWSWTVVLLPFYINLMIMLAVIGLYIIDEMLPTLDNVEIYKTKNLL